MKNRLSHNCNKEDANHIHPEDEIACLPLDPTVPSCTDLEMSSDPLSVVVKDLQPRLAHRESTLLTRAERAADFFFKTIQSPERSTRVWRAAKRRQEKG